MFDNKKHRSTAFDYSYPGLYFITICTKNKTHYFGNINSGEMFLNEYGNIAYRRWQNLNTHFPGIKLFDFIIMPNHIHGIIHITDKIHDINRKGFNPVKENKRVQKIPVIIGSYKSGVSREINKVSGNKIFAWQESYYDRVIRNEKEFEAISFYIVKNPLNWNADIESEQYLSKTEEKLKMSEVYKYYQEIVNRKFNSQN